MLYKEKKAMAIVKGTMAGSDEINQFRTWWPEILGGDKKEGKTEAQGELEFDLVDELNEDSDIGPPKCTCDFDTLWQKGCQCGGV